VVVGGGGVKKEKRKSARRKRGKGEVASLEMYHLGAGGLPSMCSPAAVMREHTGE
jgi:hypothetical protein